MHDRLKYCDNWFATNPQYIFRALYWMEKNDVAGSSYFAERKQFQSKSI